jgi:hypothetical protein
MDTGTMTNLGRNQTIIGSELLKDHEIHKMCKIVDRIIKQMSPEEQDKLEDAEVFIGYWHD